MRRSKSDRQAKVVANLGMTHHRLTPFCAARARSRMKRHLRRMEGVFHLFGSAPWWPM